MLGVKLKKGSKIINNYQILFIVNRLKETSLVLDWARSLYNRGWDIAVLPIEPQINQMQPEELNIPIIKIKPYKRWNPFIIWEICKIIKKYHIQLIHVHRNYSGGIASLAVFNNHNICVVNTEHNPSWAFRKIGLLLNSISLFRANYNCFNSNYTKESLYLWQKYLIKNIPYKVIYNGVPIREIRKIPQEISKEAFYNRWGLSKDNFYIGKIATFKKQKDHFTLLKAIKILSQKYPKIKLLLVGDGNLDKILKEKVKQLGIRKQVRFMGLLKRKEVYQLLSILNVSVMTSRWEGFCNAIVESMAAKLPVVVSDIPTLKEVVGNAGLYFRTGNSNDLAKKLEQLIINKNMRKKYANLAQNRCFNFYDNEKAIKKYEEIYRTLLKK